MRGKDSCGSLLPSRKPGTGRAVSDVICSGTAFCWQTRHGGCGKKPEAVLAAERLRRMRILPYFWETGEFPLMMKNRQALFRAGGTV